MERRFESESSSSSRKEHNSDSASSLSVIDAIKTIAAFNARASIDTEEKLLLFLQSWWSRLYNRPLKDPLLQTYTLEELLYEFYDRVERKAAEEERLEQDSDKIEEEKDKVVLDWAEAEEKRELEESLKSEATKLTESIPLDPTTDPANVAWMEEQMQAAKAVHGDSFGEDIDENFNE